MGSHGLHGLVDPQYKSKSTFLGWEMQPRTLLNPGSVPTSVITKHFLGAEVMAQGLRVLVLSKDPSCVPSAHVVTHSHQ